MHPISLPDVYSKLETMIYSISRLLQPGERLNETEREDVIGYCLEVFVACDQQLPVDLAKRLSELDLDLERFFDMCWAAMHEAELIERFTIN